MLFGFEMSPQKSLCVEGLVPNMEMFRSGAFEQCLDHEDFDLMSVIHNLIGVTGKWWKFQ
jgi:hypothetical protein